MTVLRGFHGKLLDRPVLIEAPWLDVVVRGEGEGVFSDFLRAVEDRSRNADRWTVGGIVTRTDGQTLATPVTAPIEHIAAIPADSNILASSTYICPSSSEPGSPCPTSLASASSSRATVLDANSDVIIVSETRSRSSA